MKSLFYFLFGIIVALYAGIILFDLYAPIYLDDYYVDIIMQNYTQEWYYINIITSAIVICFIIIWIYNIGEGTNHEKKEPLLINKEKNE